MKFVALVSGGKDSIHCMVHAVALGHTPVVLANLQPIEVDEMDSYMYQTVGHEVIELIAEAMELPLVRRRIEGKALNTGMAYSHTDGDEVEDLTKLLEDVQRQYPEVEAVSVGAILSNYQRIRVETVCRRLGLVTLGFLWQRDQAELLDEMVASNLHAILIKVASIGLSPAKHVGKSLAEVRTTLHSLNAKYGVHVCGEGGEFESLVLDSVLYRKRIVIDESEIVMHSDDSFAPVGYLKVRSAHLEDKPRVDHSSDEARAVAALAAATAANPEHGNPGWVFDQSDVLGSGDTSAVIPADTAQLMPLLGLHRSNENDRTSSFWGLAGGCLDAATASKQMSPGDAAKIVLADVCQLLAKRGLKPEHVMQTHLYVANMATFAEINRAYERVFRHNPPARVCVGCQLPPGQPLVMDAIVFVPAPVAGAAGAADFLHVQGRSHWAPANIGPYSQYGCASGQVMMAGQIGLVPATMKLRETTAQQAELSLNSALAVMIAAGTNPSGALACLCMVTSVDHVGLARAVFASFLQHHAAASAGRVLQVVVVDELPAAAKIEWHFVVAKDASGVAMSTMTQEDETGLEWHLSASASSGNGYVWTALTEAQVGHLASMSALGSMLGAAMAGPSGDATPEVYLARLYCAREAARGKGADHIAALSQNLREQGAAVSVIPVAMLGGGAAVHIGCHFTWPLDPDGDE